METGEREGVSGGLKRTPQLYCWVPKWVMVPLDHSRQIEMGQGFEGEDSGFSFVIISFRSWQITKEGYFSDSTKYVIRKRMREFKT